MGRSETSAWRNAQRSQATYPGPVHRLCLVTNSPCFPLREIPVHLGLGARVVPQEPFTGEADWYERYGERNVTDGVEGRLVSMHTFSEP